jgi:hypothetical protein
MLLRALAATVFEPSSSFLKKPGFLSFGVASPPRPGVLSLKPLRVSQPTAECAPDREAWLEWNETPVTGVVGLRSVSRVPEEVMGRRLRLPGLFRRARLPALVALMPPALKTLWLVMEVAVEEVVALLWTPLEELVALDFVV